MYVIFALSLILWSIEQGKAQDYLFTKNQGQGNTRPQGEIPFLIQSINTLLQSLAKGFKENDLRAIENCLQQQSTFYEALVANTKRRLARYKEMTYQFHIINTKQHNHDQRASVTVRTEFRAYDTEQKTFITESTDDLFEFQLQKNGNWKIYSWTLGQIMRPPKPSP